MRRKKILLTISNFDTAGSGKVLYDLANGLNSELFEVEIACGRPGGIFFEQVQALGLPIHIFETKTSYRPYWSLWKRVRAISRFYKQHEYDLIHSWQWSSDWTEALAAKCAGIPWIYTKKAMGFDAVHWKLKSYLARFIITINDEMGSYFPNKRSQKLIPLGIDTDYYSPLHLKKHDAAYFRIIMVANLVPVKGLEVLLEAIKLLNTEKVILEVLGKSDNAYGLSMQAYAKSIGLGRQVQFLGKKTDVRPYLEQADLYVIPTLDEGRKEGMPMALVEAMSMGVPVLGSNITGINFVLKDFKQLLFEANQAESLANKLEEMISLSKQDKHSLEANLRAYCIKHFSLQRFIEAHEGLYQELIG